MKNKRALEIDRRVNVRASSEKFTFSKHLVAFWRDLEDNQHWKYDELSPAPLLAKLKLDECPVDKDELARAEFASMHKGDPQERDCRVLRIMTFIASMGLVMILAAIFTTVLELPDFWRNLWLVICISFAFLFVVGLCLLGSESDGKRNPSKIESYLMDQWLNLSCDRYGHLVTARGGAFSKIRSFKVSHSGEPNVLGEPSARDFIFRNTAARSPIRRILIPIDA